MHMSSCQIIIEGDKEDSVSLEDPNKRHLVAEVSTNVSVLQYVCLLHLCVVYVSFLYSLSANFLLCITVCY